MSRAGIAVAATLAWSLLLGSACYRLGAYVQTNVAQAAQSKGQTKDARLAKRKNVTALAAGVRVEQAQDTTAAFFSTLRTDYETDQQNHPGIGCVLDAVSLRRWNAANSQSDRDTATEPADEVRPPAAIEGEPERGE